jgi:hypothetical protein
MAASYGMSISTGSKGSILEHVVALSSGNPSIARDGWLFSQRADTTVHWLESASG